MQKINRINETGLSLLEYKEELLKDYPPIVKNSLIASVEQMLINEVIDTVIYELITDNQEDFASFREYILSNKNYTKTHAELFKEFENVRKTLDKHMKDEEIYGLITESIVEENSIFAVKTFTIDEDFIMHYFGIQEKDLNSLMKKKGFAEKFAALRLTKVMKDIIKENKDYSHSLELDYSPAFFDDMNNTFNIEFIIQININTLNLEDDEMFENIKEIEKNASYIYGQKMVK